MTADPAVVQLVTADPAVVQLVTADPAVRGLYKVCILHIEVL